MTGNQRVLPQTAGLGMYQFSLNTRVSIISQYTMHEDASKNIQCGKQQNKFTLNLVQVSLKNVFPVTSKHGGSSNST